MFQTFEAELIVEILNYSFVDVPTSSNPSTMWSNYTGCQRLIYIENNAQAHRYLLGCDSLDCCVESQDGNQVEFQIPNVYYANPNKTAEVSYSRKNITNFSETVEVDEWSWALELNGTKVETFWAYTVDCADCANGVQLVQWKVRTMWTAPVIIQFQNYRGYDAATDEGKAFKSSFQVPSICKANNILTCPSGLHDKYFNTN